MRVSRTPRVPTFESITITLETIEEARALKLLCTTTGEDAVISKPRRTPLAVDADTIHRVGADVFNALKSQGVTYLDK